MKKNKLTTAVIAGLAGVAGVASVGNAVHVNPEGTGQVLIYPYYSVNNGLNTTYSVVNTTEDEKAIKVRFLEGQHSREVLDFNVYLSPYDVWTGVLGGVSSSQSGHSGEDSGAHASSDNSCAPLLEKTYQEFLPYEINRDAPNDNMARTTDGHFEILEMGIIDPASPVAGLATHSGGVPAGCGALEGLWNSGTWSVTPSFAILPPTGGLFGGASLINVASGFNVSYDAVALDDWSDVAQHTSPGSLTPNISNVSPAISNVFVNGTILTDVWATDAVQAVSATLMRSQVYNEYSFESDVEGKSSWVVTFPTKFHHVDVFPAVAPFTDSWDGEEACEEFLLNKWDREEMTVVEQGGISPRPPEGENPRFCYEANTVEFIAPGGVIGDSNVLGGNNLISVQGVPGGTQNGWARVSFDGSINSMTSSNTYIGLPTVGFMVQRFTNTDAEPGVLAQYGGLFNHKGMVNSSN